MWSEQWLAPEDRLAIMEEGLRSDGEDLFCSHGRIADGTEAVLRFHLAPGIRASRAHGGRTIMLVLPNREAWQFEVDQGELQLEDSVFFSAQEGARRVGHDLLAPAVVGEFGDPHAAAEDDREADPWPSDFLQRLAVAKAPGLAEAAQAVDVHL